MSAEGKPDAEKNAAEHSISDESEIDLYAFHEQAAGRLVIDPECAHKPNFTRTD
jgi:hypothetical protein